MFHKYEPFQSCTGKAQPGTTALRNACRNWRDSITGYPYGIYNCRGTSLHGEGRALDIGFPGVASPSGTALVEVLIATAWQLGLTEIIWNKKRWSARSPSGALYLGVSPHTDHIHVSQTWESARNNPLIFEVANTLINGGEDMSIITDALKKVPTSVYTRASQVVGSPEPLGTTYWGAQGPAQEAEYEEKAAVLLGALLALGGVDFEGSAGPAGPPGPAGPEGPAGPRGITGLAGADGTLTIRGSKEI